MPASAAGRKGIRDTAHTARPTGTGGEETSDPPATDRRIRARGTPLWEWSQATEVRLQLRHISVVRPGVDP